MSDLIIFVGIPGSGKSTQAKAWVGALQNYVSLSSDEYREKLLGDAKDQTKNETIFQKIC